MTAVFALIIVITILVFIHELGHFLMAKLTGCRVDEFAVGFKPAIMQKKVGGTNYVLGIIPIGGYVKIWGENGSQEIEQDKDNPEAFYNKPRIYQAVVLLGGVVFNFILAWLLFSVLLFRGTEVAQVQFPDQELNNARVVAVSVLEGYPAAQSGIMMTDTILSIESADGDMYEGDSEGMVTFISEKAAQELNVRYQKQDSDETQEVAILTQEYEGRQIAGLVLDDIGILELPIHAAIISGAVMTWDFSVTILHAFFDLVSGLFAGSADTEGLAGPVGIAGFAGQSLSGGLDSFVWFLAILSLNLAIFNLLPIPALDGGRLVFVVIESIIRRPVDPKWFMYVNVGGFVFLLGLMLIVTIFDISKLL